MQGRRSLQAQLRYLWVLVRRFRGTFASLGALVFGGSTLLWWRFAAIGKPLPYPRALLATYFLFFAQPIVEIPDDPWLMLVFYVVPPLGIFTVAEGLVRFAYLFFASQREDKEWFAVLAQSLSGHVILCGAGRVGFRVFEQFRKIGVPMVVIEKRADAPFIGNMREAGVPVLVADVRTPHALEQANVQRARAVVCATDDDLANLNIALDARKLRPGIRVVLRLFDDDLVEKAREAFDVEAFSTSALAAPAFAQAALDPTIRNSFEVGGRLMVVGEIPAAQGLAGRTVADLRDEAGIMTVHLTRARGEEVFDPRGSVRLEVGDRVTVQGTLEAYRALREGKGAGGAS